MKRSLDDIAAQYGISKEALGEIEGLIEDRDPSRAMTMALDPNETTGFDLTMDGEADPSDETVASMPDGSVIVPKTGAWIPEGRVLSNATAGTMALTAGPSLPIQVSDPMVHGLSLEVGDVFGPDGRYEDMGVLGEGGMGEVRRIRDKRLGRTLAMKLAHPEVLRRAKATSRFIEEAQVGAQLQHPGVIPVHDMGRLPDGRFFFTMREIKGREFGTAINEVHKTAKGIRWKQTASGWNFRRLISVFQRVCETMAYAHRRKIIHRDLKPANIMLGQDDEVLVVDWGLALALTGEHIGGSTERLETLRTTGIMEQTSYGNISGTPAYMPPEQARGAQAEFDERVDVYALGAILYKILTGSPPYRGKSAMMILSQLLEGEPPSPHVVTRLPLPRDLVEICQKALSHPIASRFRDAREMADAVSSWLEGVRQREKALTLVKQAKGHLGMASMMRFQATSLQEEGEALLEGMKTFSPVTDKADGWAKEDEAAVLRRDADLEETRAEQKLRGALIHSADLPEAHEALALRYEKQHRKAEIDKDQGRASHAEIVLRDHVQALPASHKERTRLEAYLQGTGRLTLLTSPEGASARLFEYVPDARRLTPVLKQDLGQTPLVEVALAPGSYLVELSKVGFETVLYPISLGRQEHWNGVPPGGEAPSPIHLPPVGSLEEGEKYVPAGWFWAGGDPIAQGSVSRRRLWCDGFVVEEHPVTNARYLDFLNDLVARGDEALALLCVPRERASTSEQGSMIYGRDEGGRFILQPDADGDIWQPDYPVMMIQFAGARHFARWMSERTGKAWRLPLDFEWEKAARGVDGRAYPWGDFLDPSWCCMRLSHKGKILPSVITDFSGDVSPYGIRGMAGNMMDMCLNRPEEAPESGGVVRVEAGMLDIERAGAFVCRGGTWLYHDTHCRVARRYDNVHTMRQTIISFRLARSLDD